MNFKKVFLLLLLFLPCSYFGILVLLIYSDPFEYCSTKPLHKGADSRDYCPIIARSHDYNFAVLGTSMSANMSCSLIDSELQVHSLKMIMNAATTYELSRLMAFCLKTGKADTYLCDLHTASYDNEITGILSGRSVREELFDPNVKMYKNVFSLMDFSFLFSFIREFSSHASRDNVFRFSRATGSTRLKPGTFSHDIQYNFANAYANVEKNLNPLFEKYPDHEFLFFLPPYNILYYIPQRLDIQLKFRSEVARRLLQYPNVRLYDFQTAQEITHNLDIYSDLTHYNARTNNWIIRQIAAGNYLIRNDSELLKASEILRKQAQSYDFDAAYERIRNAE